MLALLFAGCASAPEVKLRYFWPTPPEQPRIEWLGTYSNTLDLTQKKNPFAFIVGEDEGDSVINPAGIASDGEGRVFVGDLAKRTVLVFNFNTKEVHSLGGINAADVFKNPSGIDFDADGNIYVGDLSRKQISVFDKTEKPLRTINLSETTQSVGFFAIDRERKRIIVPDVRGHKVHIFDYDGALILTIGLFRDGKEGFSFPTSVALDSKGNIVVADSMNARLVRFTAEGTFINTISQRGDSIGDIAMVKGVALDSDGHIYMTDVKANRIQVFNEKGEALIAIGKHSTDPLQIGVFNAPTGIYIDKNDTIYITDKVARRFQIYQYLNKRYLADHPIATGVDIAKPFTEATPGKGAVKDKDAPGSLKK